MLLPLLYLLIIKRLTLSYDSSALIPQDLQAKDREKPERHLRDGTVFLCFLVCLISCSKYEYQKSGILLYNTYPTSVKLFFVTTVRSSPLDGPLNRWACLTTRLFKSLGVFNDALNNTRL